MNTGEDNSNNVHNPEGNLNPNDEPNVHKSAFAVLNLSTFTSHEHVFGRTGVKVVPAVFTSIALCLCIVWPFSVDSSLSRLIMPNEWKDRAHQQCGR